MSFYNEKNGSPINPSPGIGAIGIGDDLEKQGGVHGVQEIRAKSRSRRHRSIPIHRMRTRAFHLFGFRAFESQRLGRRARPFPAWAIDGSFFPERSSHENQR